MIDSAPLEFKCRLLGFTSLQLIFMAFRSNTEEAVPSFKRQPEQWMLLLLLSFYLQSVGNISPWKAFNIHHPRECMNHQITKCSAEELSVLPLGAGHCVWTNQYSLSQRESSEKKRKKKRAGLSSLQVTIPHRGDSPSSFQSGECFMVLNMSLYVNQN